MTALFGITFTPRPFDDLVRAVLGERPAACRLVVTANVDHVVRLHRDAAFRQAYRSAWAATVDGAPVALAAALAGVPTAGRATGADLFAAVMDGLDPTRHRPAFVVSDDEVAGRLRLWLKAQGFARDMWAIETPPFGFERDPAATEALLGALDACRPTHIFFGVGAPKSEIFVERHRGRLAATVLCVGAGIGFYLGVQRRAPRIVRAAGFEWLWRLACEPRRLARRYLVESAPFFGLALKEILRHRRGKSSRRLREEATR